jgi:hypothetical protein
MKKQMTLKDVYATLKKAGIKVKYDLEPNCPCIAVKIEIDNEIELAIYSQLQLDAGNDGMETAFRRDIAAPTYKAEYLNYAANPALPLEGTVRGFRAKTPKELVAMTKKAIAKVKGK